MGSNGTAVWDSVGDMVAAYSNGRREFSQVELSGADLSNLRLVEALFNGANFKGARLDGADCAYARLTEANLSQARMIGADLSDADLSGAILTNANISRARLNRTDLAFADLSGASVLDVCFRSVNLSEVRVSAATLLGNSVFVDTDVDPFCKVKVEHTDVSTVDFRSIVRSLKSPRLKDFLRETGMPDVFVEYMFDCARSLSPGQVASLLQSTFISYGGPDEEFARKLNDALQAQGVTTFFFKDDARPGEKLHRLMRRMVNEHDRMILVCSEASLDRPGLLNELEETLQREARDGGAEYLIPIRLDDHVFSSWRPSKADLAQAVRDRVVADFAGHHDVEAFRRALSRLIEALKKPVAHF